MKQMHAIILGLLLLAACSPVPPPALPSETLRAPTHFPSETSTLPAPTPTASFTAPPPTQTIPPAPPTATYTQPPPSDTPSASPPPFSGSLKAKVIAERFLSCRYGPGPEYLYLYALNRGANIELIGRTDGNNWMMVKGRNLCWVNAKFLEIAGDSQNLEVMYPDGYKIPVSPYYAPPTVLSAVRNPSQPALVTVTWTDITLRAGDEEDESMFIYIIETWRCEGGRLIFDPLASNYPEVTFVDEPGCPEPSHGRVYFQEKHGYAGPAEIPWPGY
jgi:uncharacterized protein YraI